MTKYLGIVTHSFFSVPTNTTNETEQRTKLEEALAMLFQSRIENDYGDSVKPRIVIEH